MRSEQKDGAYSYQTVAKIIILSSRLTIMSSMSEKKTRPLTETSDWTYGFNKYEFSNKMSAEMLVKL